MIRDTAMKAPAERALFLEALEHGQGTERLRFLESACAGNPALKQAVEELLENHRDDSFLQTPAVELDASVLSRAPTTELVGGAIGPYKILQKIGEGGCGVVYMAEQEQPIRRRVALKVIRLGMDTESVIARFEAERQALALMEHPNIAKVFDAGSTNTGRPFFVMELVRGVRITEYCDQNKISTRERLWLFMKVCHAIQHAHQKGIIHRDVKPSNILITLHDSVPVPKIIDFGVAKAVGHRLTDKTLFTQFQSFVGTPAYTSPEQAEMSGLDVDTRSDIYSLGAILYELLTGTTPFDAEELAASGLDEMRRTIREKEPLAPSSRLETMQEGARTSTASRHGSDPSRLKNLIHGDLDWIAMKALEKDRTRRYATANELAMDVQRYLTNEPVQARPPSSFYRFQKLIRRNKLPFAAAASFAVALVIGLVVTSWQILEKNQAYDRALAAEKEQRHLHQLAEKARANETRLRTVAEKQKIEAQRKSYAADMNLAAQALAGNNLGRARQLLEAQHPIAGGMDFRSWEWRYLWQLCQSDALFTLCKQSNEVVSLSVSHDGRWVSLNGDSGLSVWDLRGRKPVAQAPRVAGSILSAFSPTAPLLAFTQASRFGQRQRPQTIQFWDGASGTIVREIPLNAPCSAFSFSADGNRLITATMDQRLTIWDVATGRELQSLAAPDLRVFFTGSAFAVTANLERVAYPINDGRVSVRDLATGKELWTAQVAEEEITVLKFSPDGNVLASGGGFVESVVRLWNVFTGEEIGRLEGHRTWVSSIVFWRDGQTMATGSGDQTIRLWDISHTRSVSNGIRRPGRGPRARRPSSIQEFSALRGHKKEVWSIALVDDSTLISGSKEGYVYVWDSSAPKRSGELTVLPDALSAWKFSKEGDALVALDRNGVVSRWFGAEFHQNEPIVNLGGSRPAALFSPTARFLAALDSNSVVEIWDLDRKQQIQTIQVANGPNFPVSFMGEKEEVFLVQNFRRESIGGLQPYDVETGGPLQSWNGPSDGRVLRDSPPYFLTQNSEGMWNVFDLTNQKRFLLDSSFRPTGGMGISRNGELLAALGRDATCNLWNVPTGAKIGTLSGFLQGMHSVTFTQDGQRIAIGSNGSEAVKLWDATSLQEVLTLEGKGSTFVTIAFSPNGNLLGASNREGLMHIWKAPSFTEIEKFDEQNREEPD